MTQEDLDVLAGFGAVWERVSGQRLEQTPTPSVTREEVLQGLYDHWWDCAGLAVWAVGPRKKQLLRMAGEARDLFRRGQTECYLDTGDVFQPVMHGNLASYTPYNLQKLYKNAMKLADCLQKQQGTCSVFVEDAWKTVSAHAETAKKLLMDCLQ